MTFSAKQNALRIEFQSQEEFQSEYVRNLSIGGVFVETSDSFATRSQVCIELMLVWCGELLRLAGEVVHSVTPEMAAAGGTPGVAVQIYASTDDLRQQFLPYVKPVESSATLTGAAQRQSQRGDARVMAKVIENGKVMGEYRTRDISTTGALLADEGRPLPVGESINLAFEHPVSAETLEVEGVVVRHVKSDSGGISGMGVHFVVPDAQRSEISDFLSEMRAAEHSRRLAGISGSIDRCGIEASLRKFAAAVDEGTLVMKYGGDEGSIGFRKGRFTGARVGRSAGRVALRKLLAWREGEFEMISGLDDRGLDDVRMDLDAVIARAKAENDRSSSAAPLATESMRSQTKTARPILPGSKFSVMHERIDADSTDLCKTEEAVLDLAAVGMTVLRMADVIPESERDIHDSIHGLIERGFIEFA